MKILDSVLRTDIQQRFLQPTWIIVALLTIPFLLGAQVPLSWQLLPLVASAALFGMPHGAIDHLVPGRVGQRDLTRLEMVGLLGGYLLLMAAVLVLWFSRPIWGFAFFILLTWFHWGLGDLFAVVAFIEPALAPSRAERALIALVRGALPMLVPLLLFPQDYALALEAIAGSFALDGGSLAPAWLTSPGFRFALAGILGNTLAAALAIAAYRAAQHKRWSAWWIYAGEMILLVVFFLVVPAFLAVGVYFTVWHSLRHIVRLLLIDEPSRRALQAAQPWQALGRFMREALPFTVVALVMVGALVLVVPSQPDELVELIGLYLALIAALTLPHTIIVLWMDFRQGLWNPTSSEV